MKIFKMYKTTEGIYGYSRIIRHRLTYMDKQNRKHLYECKFAFYTIVAGMAYIVYKTQQSVLADINSKKLKK